MMIDVLLKESWDFGVLVPGNHTILAEVYQGFGRVRADEAVQAAYDKNHRDVSLHGMSRCKVDEEVVALSASCEVFLGIINRVVGTQFADDVDILCARHSRDFGSKRLGNLNRERSYSTTGAVDQYFLSGLYMPMVTDSLECSETCDADGGRLFKRTVPWLEGYSVFFRGCIF